MIGRTAAILLTTTLLGNARAGIDPPNATQLQLQDDFGQPIHYNVTHTYFRDALADLNIAWNETARRCVSTSPVHTLGYWINEYEMPNEIQHVDGDGMVRSINTPTETIGHLMQRLGAELELNLRRVNANQYYNMLHRLMLEPQRKYQGLLPIQIHFRVKPYPQSSFGEFVSDRSLVWRTYDPAVYAMHAGHNQDLLYRFRHNFRHSLGLGHRNDRRSIMYPTNVRGLRVPDRFDTDAVHRLLCDPSTNLHQRRPAVLKTTRPLTQQDVQRLAFSSLQFHESIGPDETVVVLKPRNGR